MHCGGKARTGTIACPQQQELPFMGQLQVLTDQYWKERSQLTQFGMDWIGLGLGLFTQLRAEAGGPQAG